MATVNGVQAAKYQASPRDLIPVNAQGGRMRVMYDEFTFAAHAAGTIVRMGGPLPKGARIVGGVLMHADLGTTAGTLKVGDELDDDRFLAAFATGSAGKKPFDDATSGVAAGFGFELTVASQIIVTTAGAAVTGLIQLAVHYVID